MSLFNETFGDTIRELVKSVSDISSKFIPYDEEQIWKEGKSVVLKEETAIEIGSSGGSSLFTVLWSDQLELVEKSGICLIGPNLASLEKKASCPLGLIVLIEGVFDDAYETFRLLRDAVYHADPLDVAARFRPSRLDIWFRISHKALSEGFDFCRYGNLLLKRLLGIDGVKKALLVFITDNAELIERIRPHADRSREIVEALIKMYEEMNFDCETCEHADVCDEVAELRKIRDRLKGEN